MRMILLLLLSGLFALPASAAQNQLLLGVSTAVRYDTNVGATESSTDDSFGYEFGPSIGLRSDSNQWGVGLRYTPSYITNTSNTVNDEWRQWGSVNGHYDFSERTSITVSDSIRFESDANRDFQNNAVPPTQVESGTKDILINQATMDLTHLFTQRLSLVSGLEHGITEYEDKDLSDIESIVGRVSLNYALNTRSSAGGGVRASYQSLDQVRTNPGTGSTTGFYTIFGSGSHAFTPHLRVSVDAGPTIIVEEIQGDRSKRDTEIDFFARASMDGEWQQWTGSLNFRRSESTSSFSGISQTINAVDAQVRWTPSRDWVAALNLGYNRRESITKSGRNPTGFQISNDVDQWRVAGTVSRRLTRGLIVHLTADYLRQDDQGRSPDGSSFSNKSDRVRLFLRFDYDLVPIRF